jgi:hypothetical protein
MMFPPHQWGPDPSTPDTTICLWCKRPFTEYGGTSCPMNARAREAAVEATTKLLLTDLPTEPPPRRAMSETSIDAFLIAMVVLVCLVVVASIIGLATSHGGPAQHEPTRPTTPTRYIPT